jgi:hypothetical protein
LSGRFPHIRIFSLHSKTPKDPKDQKPKNCGKEKGVLKSGWWGVGHADEKKDK